MNKTEKVVNDLNVVKLILYNPQMLTAEMCIRIGQAITNAMSLLREQDAVKPVVDIDTWKCGNCGHTLEYQELLGDNVLFHEQYNYCPECGKEVKWDE